MLFVVGLLSIMAGAVTALEAEHDGINTKTTAAFIMVVIGVIACIGGIYDS